MSCDLLPLESAFSLAGIYSAEAIAGRRELAALIRSMHGLVEEMDVQD